MNARTRSKVPRPSPSIYVKSISKCKPKKVRFQDVGVDSGIPEISFNQQEVKRWTDEYTECAREFNAIPGVSLIYGIPHISKRCLDRPVYAKQILKLTDAVKQADLTFLSLTGELPGNSRQYVDAVFDKYSVPREVYKVAMVVETVRGDLEYFVDTRMSVDLDAMRVKVVQLQERIRQAKYDLRRLQHMGEDIGNTIFPLGLDSEEI
jgi:hypothetical protein